jgi:hypothetical protein
MSFVGDVLDSVNGIQWFYIAGILIFIALFIVILYRTSKIPKTDIEKFKNGILDSDETSIEKDKIYQSE